MAYLAMARKWRPKNFEDMVGQDHIAQTIRNAIEGKRISHAYLFTGTRGVGKTTSARILAKALNCKKGPTPIPCDACENCKAVNNGSSMDVLEIDGASNNSVDNIRELREQVNYAPMNGTYKIYVIDEVHMLSKSAFNALLKTLEEPPPHVVFIFATTEANKLPHTILSRVQRFDFKRISEQNIRERLEYICGQESIKPEREALEAIARKADGSMRDALSLFDQVYAFSGADLSMEAARKVLGLPRDGMFDGLLRALIQHDQKACFTTLQEAHREGIETSELLVAFGEYLRNMLFARQGVGPGALGLGDARYGELISLAPELRDGDIIRFAKMVSDILAQIKLSASPRLAVELGFARMAALDRVVTLSQVLGQDFVPAQAPGLAANPASSPSTAADLDEVKKKSPREPLIATAAPAPTAPPMVPPAVPPPAPPVAAVPDRPAAPAAQAPVASQADVPAAELENDAGYPAEAEPAGFTPSAAADFEAASAPQGDASLEDFAPLAATTAVMAPPLAGPRAGAIHPGIAIPESLEPDTGSADAPGSPYPYAGMPMDPEAEMDSDPDLDLDPEADGPAAPRPMAPVAAPDPESLTVPVQDSPEALPGVWSALVAEFMSLRPLLGANLRRTRLESEPGETPALRVVFLERTAYNLIDEDADFRKSIQAFLAGKSKGKQAYPVRFFLDEEAAAASASAQDTIQAGFGPVDPATREPIINFIRDVFEARIV
ncbi:MAG: polymerase subunit gamma and tau [Fibrobacteres bacterium]|nr:polymerase subunit gamma and tau [Fibrobacterota bacterium]